MKVTLDARALKKQGGGISLYIERLIQKLPQGVEITALCRQGIAEGQFSFGRPVKVINLDTDTSAPTENNLKIDTQVIPPLLQKLGTDIYHACSNWGTQGIDDLPTVLTVHDVIPMEIREDSFADDNVFTRYKDLLSSSLKQAGKIITISKYSQEKISRYFNANPRNISVIYNGSDEAATEGISDAAIRKLNLEVGKYFVYVGGFYERKNLPKLIEAYLASAELGGYKLVVTGSNDSNEYVSQRFRGFQEQIKGHDDRIVYAGYVARSDLNGLIASSTALIFPSLSEGFGLPIIEGMGLGTVVLASNASCLQEIGGDVPVYFNPNNVREMSQAMSDVALGRIDRPKKIAAGLERAKQYTWEKCARETYDVYNKLVK